MLSPLKKVAWGLSLCREVSGVGSEKPEVHDR